jgi:hypothetical protein
MRDKPSGRLREILGGVAPELAGALGGPLAGRVTSILARALLGQDDAGEETLARALETAGPETLRAIALAGYAFEEAKLEAATEARRIAQADRANARAREKAVKDRLPAVLAVSVVVGFFCILALMLLRDIPDGAETEFSIMLGALGAMAAAVMNYYFGSSASSRHKTELIGRGLPGNAERG